MSNPSGRNRDEETFGDYMGETTRFLSWIQAHRVGMLPASVLQERVARLRASIAPILFYDLSALKKAIIEVKKKKLANLDATIKIALAKLTAGAGDETTLRKQLDDLYERRYKLLKRIRAEKAELPPPTLTYPGGTFTTDDDGNIQVTDKNKDDKLSTHFKLREFVCPADAALPATINVPPKLVELLEKVREKVGKAVRVECTTLVRVAGKSGDEMKTIVEDAAKELNIAADVSTQGDAAKVVLK